jgi:hypothetical protein
MSSLSQVDCQGEAELVPDPSSSFFREMAWLLVVVMTMANPRSVVVSFMFRVSVCGKCSLPPEVRPFPAHSL